MHKVCFLLFSTALQLSCTCISPEKESDLSYAPLCRRVRCAARHVTLPCGEDIRATAIDSTKYSEALRAAVPPDEPQRPNGRLPAFSPVEKISSSMFYVDMPLEIFFRIECIYIRYSCCWYRIYENTAEADCRSAMETETKTYVRIFIMY